MGAHGGPKVEDREDLAVYTDAASTKGGIEAGTGLSSNKRTLTKAGDAVRGEYGGVTCITFDGTNDGVDFSPAVSIAHTDPWTFTVWFYIGNSSSRHRRNLLCTRGVLDTAGYITYYYDSSTDANGDETTRVRLLVREERTAGGWAHFSLYPGPYGSSYVLTSLQNDYWCNQWHHLVVRKGYGDAGRFDTFLNGEYTGGTNRSTGYVNNGLDADSFGGNGRYAGWYGGLGGPKIYTKALSDKAITRLYKRFANRYGK